MIHAKSAMCGSVVLGGPVLPPSPIWMLCSIRWQVIPIVLFFSLALFSFVCSFFHLSFLLILSFHYFFIVNFLSFSHSLSSFSVLIYFQWNLSIMDTTGPRNMHVLIREVSLFQRLISTQEHTIGTSEKLS